MYVVGFHYVDEKDSREWYLKSGTDATPFRFEDAEIFDSKEEAEMAFEEYAKQHKVKDKHLIIYYTAKQAVKFVSDNLKEGNNTIYVITTITFDNKIIAYTYISKEVLNEALVYETKRYGKQLHEIYTIKLTDEQVAEAVEAMKNGNDGVLIEIDGTIIDVRIRTDATLYFENQQKEL